MHVAELPAGDGDGARLARSLSRSFALHVGVRTIEALSIGWLAGALVAACAALTMRAPISVQGWIAAAVCGVCAAASTWIPHPPRRAEHVRSVDGRLVLGGALVTSAQILPTARSGTLSAALVRRVADRAQSSALLRAALPRTPLALLAALAGSAVLFAAQDAIPATSSASSRIVESPAAALGAAAQAVRSAALEESSSRANPSSGPALTALADDLDKAARSQERSSMESRREGVKDETDRLRQAVESARPSASSPRAARALDLARAAVDSMPRDSMPRVSAPASGAGAGADRRPADGASATGPRAGAPEASPSLPDGSTSTALASAPQDGRMSARNADPRAHSGPRAIVSTSGAGERGVGATRWWPSSYDAIVEGWLSADASGR